jgi:hypothetical protein
MLGNKEKGKKKLVEKKKTQKRKMSALIGKDWKIN